MKDQSKTLIEMIAARVKAGDRESAPLLFRMVAERIRSRLDPGESDVVAEWFDRLAAGDEPKSVFWLDLAGRPRGKTRARKPMTYGRIPDDIDIAWIVRQNIGKAPKSEIYAGVAKAFGMKAGTVRNIYAKNKALLAKPAQ